MLCIIDLFLIFLFCDIFFVEVLVFIVWYILLFGLIGFVDFFIGIFILVKLLIIKLVNGEFIIKVIILFFI